MARGKKEEKQEVKKDSASIQIENNITLLQRKAWNVMLWYAYDDLPTKAIHEISVQQIMRLIGYDSKNDEYLKEALEALSECKVKWNMLDKDGAPDWGFAVLLASASIKHGVCSYGFAPHLRHKLYNPDIFARLDLDMQKRFDSKHALALWELCTDYLGAKREHGETPWIEVEEFRKLMGVKESDYYAGLFKELNRKIIIPSIGEINRISDFRVTVEYQRQGRKITALKFKMRRVAMLSEAGAVQIKMFPDLEDMPAVVAELKAAGLSTSDAWEIWQKGFVYVQEDVRPKVAGDDDGAAFLQYVREKIHLLKRRHGSGKVENSTGFLLESIKKNYSNPEYAAEIQQEINREALQAKRERERQIKALEAHKAVLEKARDKALEEEGYSLLVDDEPGLLEDAAAWAMREVKGFQLLYDGGKSASENYQDRYAVQALLNPYLKQQRPEYFQVIEERYAAEIAAIDAQISSLNTETGG